MKFLLTSNDNNLQATNAMHMAITWLERHKIETQYVSADVLLLGHPVYEELRAKIASFDMVCAFGGDGTILRATRLTGGSGVPLLGFNYGHLGFLAGATAVSTVPALEAALAGEVVQERRVMVAAKCYFEDGTLTNYTALNEFVLSRSNAGQVIHLGLAINGHHLMQLRCDGIIVATATGSTAYALSAGGPLLTPEHKGMSIVPIAPHALATRAIVTDPSDTMEFTHLSTEGQQLTIFADGQEVVASDAEHGAVNRVVIQRSPNEVILLRYNAPDFYEGVAETFFGGLDAR